MSYNSKYTGAEVEALLERIDEGNAYNAGDIYMMDDDSSITAEQFNAIYEAITAKKTIYSRIVIEDFIAYVFFQAFADENGTTRSFTLRNMSDSVIVSIRANSDALVIVRKVYAIPSKTSELTNDSGYLTEHQDISGKADKATTLSGYGITDAYTKTEVSSALSGKAEAEHTHTVSQITDFPELVYDATPVYEAAKNGTLTDDQFVELANASLRGLVFLGDNSDRRFVAVSQDYSDYILRISLTAVTHSSDGISVDIYIIDSDTLTVEERHEVIEQKYTSATSSSGTVELSDTKMFILGEQSAVTITLPSGAESNGREYLCQFTASSSGCTLSVPDTVSWLGGDTPTINAGKTYQLSIVNNLAVIGEF